MFKNFQKKFIGIILTLAMVISLMPAMTLFASAEAGDTWTDRTAANSTATDGAVLISVCYGGSTFVAVGQNGTIISSTDGINWTKRTSNTTLYLSGVSTNGSGTFVAVAGGNTTANGVIVTSTNYGATWSSQAFTATYASVCYGNGFFMAFADGKCYTSADGSTWVEKGSVDNYAIYGLAYHSIDGTETYVGVGTPDDFTDYNGNYLYRFAASTNSGTSWSRDVSHLDTLAANLNSVCYGAIEFVAVGDGGSVFTSSTGQTGAWTKRAFLTNMNLQDICYANDRYIAVGYTSTYNAIIYSSTDGGANWTSKTPNTTNELRGVCYGNNMVVAVGINGTILTSAGAIAPTLTSATYNASTGILAVTGANMTTGDTIDVSKLTVTGQGGSTYTLTSANVFAESSTTFNVTLNAADKLNVNGLLNKSGASPVTGTAYNLAGAASWDATRSTTADLTGNAINVTNVQIPTITSAAYDAATSVLTVTGTNMVKQVGATNDINVSELTLKGEGGATYTLTTNSVEITSGTEFAVALNATDIAAVGIILNTNGLSSTGGTAYNLAVADDWNSVIGDSDISDATCAVTVSNVTLPSAVMT